MVTSVKSSVLIRQILSIFTFSHYKKAHVAMAMLTLSNIENFKKQRRDTRHFPHNITLACCISPINHQIDSGDPGRCIR